MGTPAKVPFWRVMQDINDLVFNMLLKDTKPDLDEEKADIECDLLLLEGLLNDAKRLKHQAAIDIKRIFPCVRAGCSGKYIADPGEMVLIPVCEKHKR